jgi:hypothetical protein
LAGKHVDLLLRDWGSLWLLGCRLTLNAVTILLAALNLSRHQIRGVATHRLCGFLKQGLVAKGLKILLLVDQAHGLTAPSECIVKPKPRKTSPQYGLEQARLLLERGNSLLRLHRHTAQDVGEEAKLTLRVAQLVQEVLIANIE